MLVVLAISSCIFCSAQEHLKFKGIPIDGTLKEFTAKLQQEGYKVTFTNDEGYGCVLKGSFAGFSDCKILVIATETSHIVWKVVVKFPEQTSWYSLKSRFDDYKTSMAQKYGEPSGDYHFFSKPYYEGDGYEFQALKKDKCNYAAFFDVPEGGIIVEIQSVEYNSGCVAITYEDKKNAELKKQDRQNSINNDL